MRYVSFLLLNLLLIPSLATAQGNLNVVTVSPAANAVSAEREAAIVIDFDQAVDPATLDASSAMVFGRWSGVMKGDWLFEMENTRMRFVP